MILFYIHLLIININVINPDAENTFAALGMDGSDEAVKAFAEKLSGITSKILDGMTGKTPDFNRNNALKKFPARVKKALK